MLSSDGMASSSFTVNDAGAESPPEQDWTRINGE